eukprot:TRINITY_DN4439_c0_g1_i1.p1 TRINITY_DN4439_c0_g1~~TRINITY_DN4439_c0_g1_i1.p1  ORF type:complete len:888 (-),score=204.22 TRINITY_DN4439_c0_g1_i1:105-2768(-)
MSQATTGGNRLPPPRNSVLGTPPEPGSTGTIGKSNSNNASPASTRAKVGTIFNQEKGSSPVAEEEEDPVTQVARKKKQKRMNVIEELYDTEKEYVEDLKRLVKIFLTPLRASGVIPEADINSIFCNVELILGINSELLKNLTQRLKTETQQQSASAAVGDIFTNMADSFKAYDQYCVNYKKAMDTMTKCEKSTPAFSSFLEKCEVQKEVNLLELRDFLIKPIQRICKYPLLFKEILKHTEPEHPDYKILQITMAKLEEVATNINISRSEAENIQKLLEIENKMSGYEDQKNKNKIAIQGRKFVYEGKITKMNERNEVQERWFILLSDILVYCKLSRKTSADNSTEKSTYIYKGTIPMNVSLPRTIPEGSIPNVPAGQEFAFEIIRVDTKRIYKLYCATLDEKTRWLKKLSDVISSHLAKGSIKHNAKKKRQSVAPVNEEIPNVDTATLIAEIKYLRYNEAKQKETIIDLEDEVKNKKEVEDRLSATQAALKMVSNQKEVLSEANTKLEKQFKRQSALVAKLLAEGQLSKEDRAELASLSGSNPLSASSANTSTLNTKEESASTEEVRLVDFIKDSSTVPSSPATSSASTNSPNVTASTPVNPTVALEDIIKLGYLSKKGAKRRNWNTRWCILKKDAMLYFANPLDRRPKGIVPLSGCSVSPSTRKPFCFCISNVDRDYLITAKNQKEQQEWMDAIKSCIEGLVNEDTENMRRSAYQANSEKEGTLLYEDMKKWKQNWITLQGNRLYLFTNRTDAWPHGVIELENCTVTVGAEKKKFVFVISNPTIGMTRFCAATEREMAEWVAAIDLASREANAAMDSEINSNSSNNNSTKTTSSKTSGTKTGNSTKASNNQGQSETMRGDPRSKGKEESSSTKSRKVQSVLLYYGQ